MTNETWKIYFASSLVRLASRLGAAVLRRLDGEVIGNSVSSLNDLANTPVSTVQDLDHLAMFGLPRRSLQGESSASEGIATASS